MRWRLPPNGSLRWSRLRWPRMDWWPRWAKVSVEPNAANVIPGIVTVSLDVRHAHDGSRISAVKKLIDSANAIAERRGLALQCTGQMDQPAVPMDERLTAFLADAIEAGGMPVKHDAERRRPRRHGDGRPRADGDALSAQPRRLSHHPAETVLEEDVEAALHVGSKFLERLAA